jgi:hypothetical protein
MNGEHPPRVPEPARARRVVPAICAILFALFHVLTVVQTLVTTQGSGGGQGFLVLFLDLPLVLLLQAVPGGGHILYGSLVAYIWFFSIAGTLLYATVGYGVGLGLRALLTFLSRP